MVFFTLAVTVLLMTADVVVRADEDDTDEEQTGWFADFCSCKLAAGPGGVA